MYNGARSDAAYLLQVPCSCTKHSHQPKEVRKRPTGRAHNVSMSFSDLWTDMTIRRLG